MEVLLNLWQATGIANFTFPALIMIAVGGGIVVSGNCAQL